MILPIIETVMCIACLILHIIEADLRAFVHLILHIIDSVMKGCLTWNVLSRIRCENLVQVMYLLKNHGANLELHSMLGGGAGVLLRSAGICD